MVGWNDGRRNAMADAALTGHESPSCGGSVLRAGASIRQQGARRHLLSRCNPPLSGNGPGRDRGRQSAVAAPASTELALVPKDFSEVRAQPAIERRKPISWREFSAGVS